MRPRSLQYAADNLAVCALLIQAPLAGQNQIRIGHAVLKACYVQLGFDAALERAPQQRDGARRRL